MISDIIIREGTGDDQEKILNLLNSVFASQERSGTLRDGKFWDWKYGSNVFSQSHFTVAEDNGNIVGMQTLWPWQVTINNTCIEAFQICDSSVHPDYRGKGLFKKICIKNLETALNHGAQLIFNYPNKNSLPGWKSLHSTYLGKIPWLVKPLHPLNIVRSVLSNSKSTSLSLEQEYKLDTDMLDKLSLKYGIITPLVQVSRVKGFFDWRYIKHPTKDYGMVLSKNGDSAAIFLILLKGAYREMVVVDLIGSTKDSLSLFKEIIKAAKRNEADYIAVMNNTLYKLSDLWRLGFIPFHYKNMVAKSLDPGLKESIVTFGNWSLMGAFHDTL